MFAGMIPGQLFEPLIKVLAEASAVCLLGLRQVEKTTLSVSEKLGVVYLDLESEQDRDKLIEPEMYLERHLDKLVSIITKTGPPEPSVLNTG